MKTPISLLVHITILRGCLATCYYPDGSVATQDRPCNPDAEHSPCCASQAGEAFACLSNALCEMPNGSVARGSCTDPTWRAPECPKYCMNWGNIGWDLISCANTTHSDIWYCCDHMPNCCGGVGMFSVLPSQPTLSAQFDASNTQYVLLPPVSTATTSSSSSTSSTSSSTPSTTTGRPSQQTSVSSASPFSGSPPPPTQTGQAATGSETSTPVSVSTGLSTAAQAGIGAGAGVGALLAAAVAYLWWRLRKSEQARRAGPSPQWQHESAGGSTAETLQPLAAAPLYYPQEPGPKAELQGYGHTHELQGHSYIVHGSVNNAEITT